MTKTMTRNVTLKPVNGAADEDAMRIEALREAAIALEHSAHALAEQFSRARGTRDIPVTTIQAVAGPSPEAPKSKLYTSCETLLSEKPHTFRDLCEALQLPPEQENSLKSVIVRLQRDGAPIVNLGNGSRAIWWIDVHGRIAEIASGRTRTMSPRR